MTLLNHTTDLRTWAYLDINYLVAPDRLATAASIVSAILERGTANHPQPTTSPTIDPLTYSLSPKQHLHQSWNRYLLRQHPYEDLAKTSLFNATCFAIGMQSYSSLNMTSAFATRDSVSSSDLSSDLSSVGSLSPPPADYPSPVSSQDYVSSTPASQPPSRKRSREPEDAPPTKKRRKVEAKLRTTEHLYLHSSLGDSAPAQSAQLNLLLKVLQKRQKIVVIAGAGISVSAGSTCDWISHCIKHD